MIKIQYNQGRITKNLFSLCFGHEGGYLTLGDYDTSRHLKAHQIEEISFDRSTGQYKLDLLSIFVWSTN